MQKGRRRDVAAGKAPSIRCMRFCILVVTACVLLLAGCEPRTRYAVLSFFFDGVPDPESVQAREKTAERAASGAEKHGEVRSSTIHGPYAARICSACHDPNTNTLLLPRDKICLKCHTFPPFRKEHGPFASGGCLACHDPHRSNYKFLLVAAPKEFCLYCHESKEIFSRKVHQLNHNTSCIVCHSPHGSDKDFFLRE